MATPRICSIDECDKPAKSYGWCNSHYERWRKHGDPTHGRTGHRLGTAPGETLHFYESTVLNYTGEPCLIWPYARNEQGYAVWNSGPQFAKAGAVVSRQVCWAVNGPPPTMAHQAAHSCGKGHDGCVAKSHLSWKNRVENDADKILHGTTNRGERCGSAKLTEADVRAIRAASGHHKDIAKQHGVGRTMVTLIRSRKRWAWLD